MITLLTILLQGKIMDDWNEKPEIQMQYIQKKDEGLFGTCIKSKDNCESFYSKDISIKETVQKEIVNKRRYN